MIRPRNTPGNGGRKTAPSGYQLVLALSLFVTLSLWSQNTSAGQAEIRAHAQKAQDALKSGDRDAAESEFRAILALDPNNIDARGNVGVMRFFQGDWAGAAEQFRQVLKVQPSFWKAQALLGICEKRLGHPGEAKRLLERSVPHLDDGALRVQAGLELVEIPYQAGDLDKAAEIVGTLQHANPANADVLYTAYRIYADLADRARDTLALVAPESSRMHQIMAQHLINEGDIPGAITQYHKALAIDPKLSGIHYELGEAILKDSTSDAALQQAEEQFRAALAENPGDAGAEYRLGRVSAQRLDFTTAVEHYSRALAVRPDYAHAQIALGEALMKMGESQKALEHLLAASRLDPLNPTVHYRLANIYRELGREDDDRRELAAFKKLREWNKLIERVYQQMHQLVPEGDAIPPDAPRE